MSAYDFGTLASTGVTASISPARHDEITNDAVAAITALITGEGGGTADILAITESILFKSLFLAQSEGFNPHHIVGAIVNGALDRLEITNDPIGDTVGSA